MHRDKSEGTAEDEAIAKARHCSPDNPDYNAIQFVTAAFPFLATSLTIPVTTPQNERPPARMNLARLLKKKYSQPLLKKMRSDQQLINPRAAPTLSDLGLLTKSSLHQLKLLK